MWFLCCEQTYAMLQCFCCSRMLAEWSDHLRPEHNLNMNYVVKELRDFSFGSNSGWARPQQIHPTMTIVKLRWIIIDYRLRCLVTLLLLQAHYLTHLCVCLTRHENRTERKNKQKINVRHSVIIWWTGRLYTRRIFTAWHGMSCTKNVTKTFSRKTVACKIGWHCVSR